MLLKWKKKTLSKTLDSNIARFYQGDLSVLPLIFDVLCERSPVHQRQAAGFFEHLLTTRSLQQILMAENAMRRQSWDSPCRNIERWPVKGFLSNEMNSEQKKAVLVFCSFHPSGFIREKALTLLAEYEGTLPYVILRLTDWVPQVRLAAFSSAQRQLDLASEREILAAIPWFERIKGKKHTAPDTYMDLLIAEIKKRHAPLIIRGIESKESSVKRFSLNILLKEPQKNEERLKHFLVTERDMALKKKTFETLVTAGADLYELAIGRLSDRQPRMRLLAMRYLAIHEKNLPLQCAWRMLSDQNQEIRSMARQAVLTEQPETDFHSFYRALLNEDPAVAVAGLGETGSLQDTALIEPFLSQEEGKVKRAAMVALMQLDPLKYQVMITEQLQSDQVPTAKIARALLERYDTIDFEHVFRILKSSQQTHTRLLCARLLNQAGKWQRLIYSLCLLDIAGEDLQRIGEGQLRRWVRSFNRSQIAPSQEQLREIRDLLQEKQGTIESELLCEISFRLS